MAADGVTVMVECGAGSALVGMARRIVPGLRLAHVDDPASLDAAAGALGMPAGAPA